MQSQISLELWCLEGDLPFQDLEALQGKNEVIISWWPLIIIFCPLGRLNIRPSTQDKGRVDNTFHCDSGLPPARVQLRHCHNYVRELDRLRQFTEFEASNQKRLMRRQYFADSEATKAPLYSQGSSSFTIRPPTGVDLALGLSGYDKLGNDLPPSHKQRPPCTLQPLKDEDEEMKRRVAKY